MGIGLAQSGRVLITGGAGYVGARLVPRLLARGTRVRVYDSLLFGDEPLAAVAEHPHLEIVAGDLRDHDRTRDAVAGCDAVIHLACVSNDPSFELDPQLGREVNYDAFPPLVRACVDHGVRRMIYASSSSVYGVSDAPSVTEEHPLHPLTDYSRFKALCEPILLAAGSDTLTPIVVRPATVCGMSPRLRLDLTVNILTNHAVHRGKITVFGGTQKRPNIHIDDLCDLYEQLLDEPNERVHGKIYNAGYENHTVRAIAEQIRDRIAEVRGTSIPIETTPTDDLRSYHIDSGRIARELGFRARRTIGDAVTDLLAAFDRGEVPNPLDDPRYYNVRVLQEQAPLRTATS